MFLINESLIKSVKLTDDHIVMIIWQSYWHQEDIDTLTSTLIKHVEGAKITENVVGADRINIRFCYKKGDFILNFENYSQSCWIEAEDESSEVFIAQIAQSITSLIV